MQNAKLRNLEGNLRSNLTICNPSRRGGFTLIEIIIVLSIIALASGLIGIVIYRRAGNLELNTFTKHASATLRYARNHAVSEKKKYSFIIMKDRREYGLYVDFPSIEDIEEASPVVYKTIPDTLKITFKNRGDYFRIDFFPRGNSSGGTLEITNQKGKTFFILVNRITGRVKVK